MQPPLLTTTTRLMIAALFKMCSHASIGIARTNSAYNRKYHEHIQENIHNLWFTEVLSLSISFHLRNVKKKKPYCCPKKPSVKKRSTLKGHFRKIGQKY